MAQSKRKKPGRSSKKARSARTAFGNNYCKIMPIPEINAQYQLHMGDVDQRDQLRAAVPWRRERKNWRALFGGLLGIAIINSYLLSYHASANKKRHLSFTDFRVKLYTQLWEHAERPN